MWSGLRERAQATDRRFRAQRVGNNPARLVVEHRVRVGRKKDILDKAAVRRDEAEEAAEVAQEALDRAVDAEAAARKDLDEETAGGPVAGHTKRPNDGRNRQL